MILTRKNSLMALTLFLFNVSNLDISKTKSDYSTENLLQINESSSDENAVLLSAKVNFRGLNLWSNNVPLHDGTASFIARGKKPKKFTFNLATMLMPDDKVRLEFYAITMKKKRKRLVAIFELMLESIIDLKHIDLPEENLSDTNNYLLSATVQLKLFYTSPNLDRERNVLGTQDDEITAIDWMSRFDDDGRHGGHRHRYIHSKRDRGLKKLRGKFASRTTGDADTDSYSDEDFIENDPSNETSPLIHVEQNLRNHRRNLELLEKSLGRYEGDVYHLTEWQILVHVIQGRDFPGSEVNPYVCIQIDDQKRYTGVQKSSNSPFFGEFFTFDLILPATQMMEKMIFFKVHHSKKFLSQFTDTKPIGIFKVDLATIYNERDHSFERKWAQLINPESIEISAGHLLLSIAVTERGSSSKNILGELSQGDDELKPSKRFIPSAMPRHLFPVQLKMTFHAADELPEMMTDFLATVSKKFIGGDQWEAVDPYVEVTYNGIRSTTEHRNGSSPMWNEALYLIGQFPPLVRTLKIALKDKTTVQQDRIIGSFLLDLFLISESNPSIGFLPTLGPTWIFLYGSPREYSISKDQDGLAEGMGEGVCYKGKLLMEIESHPISADHPSNTNIQKESSIPFPSSLKFPLKRTFVLFACLYDVTMIDKSFGNGPIMFELSIGPSGYLNPEDFSKSETMSSITRVYPSIPIENNSRHFRLPIDLEKPILFTKYIFHDYSYRMNLSNRLKQIAHHLSKLVENFEMKINQHLSYEILTEEFHKMEEYLKSLPCGCHQNVKFTRGNQFVTMNLIHRTLYDYLSSASINLRMNNLDEKRRKKILIHLDLIQNWMTKDIEFDPIKPFETIKELQKIVRVIQQMSFDIQPSLPDVFLWMIFDGRRVAYVRLQAEDLFYSPCQGERGLHNGRVQTLFLRTPQTSDKPLKSSTNAKVQIYFWLGTEDNEEEIFKQLPSGFQMPSLPLTIETKSIRYLEKSLYELRCHCYKARSLIASDETGLSDPYLSITVGNETQTTPILKESLCPQWNITLVFRNLVHVGNRQTAEEIIGHVVVECYDYDESGDQSDLIGRFSTTARLNLFNGPTVEEHSKVFRWFEFKFDGKRAGELLAVFELIPMDFETNGNPMRMNLDEIEINRENFPRETYVTKFLRNPIYEIPSEILPKLQTYQIEVMFWGLRECRPIHFQSIQQAEVSIECSGVRITKTIRDVEKNPNFEVTSNDTDKYHLLVNLPKDSNFWPHLSICCVQNRLFGMKEIVGNLVVTDLQKYLEKPSIPLTKQNELLVDTINEVSKRISYHQNRVRRSVIDAYEAVVADKNLPINKRKLTKFDLETFDENPSDESQISIIDRDVLANQNEKHLIQDENIEDERKHLTTTTTTNEVILDSSIDRDDRQLSINEKVQRIQMEKEATWWSKYYASKAKLKLEQKPKLDLDEGLEENPNLFAEMFDDETKIVMKSRWTMWKKTKKIFQRAGKVRQNFKNFAVQRIENLTEKRKIKSAVDESLDLIENDRLKQLTLLQTFDIVETELENVYDYEGFNDCLEKFPLYKGKGASRSDEIGDEKRVYAKFKGKFRIRDVSSEMINVEETRPERRRKSMNPITFHHHHASLSKKSSTNSTNDQIHQFDLNRNPIALKCRLYIIKALLFRAWDRSGKADPYIKIFLNNDLIIDDVKSRLYNTLEPIFGKFYEFEITIPQKSLLRIQVWDWDLACSNDKIAETSIDIENRWFSAHRATCGLSKRYDSAGYNAWRDTKKPVVILNEMCRTLKMNLPIYTSDFHSLAIGDVRFDCPTECLDFVQNGKASELSYRKVAHESNEEYIRQNTALVALHSWPRKINSKWALVSEHIECRSLFDPTYPDIEQGKLEMWLDFFPMSRPPSTAPVDITPPKPVAYQLRVTIWNTSDVELNDENLLTGEKTSDIYVKGWILGEKEDAQQTDIHYRSLTGEGNFNWRFIYNFNYLEIEEKIVFEKKDSVFQVGNTTRKFPPRVVIRVYDADLLSADDFLGECVLDLTHLPIGGKTSNKCKAEILLNTKHRSLNLFVHKRVAGWWPMIAPRKSGEIRDETLLAGKVEVEFALLTAEEAERNPVGKAREAPQPLDEPNRPTTSFLWFTSPWKTFRYVIWKNFKWPILIGIFSFILVVFLLLALWTLPGEFIRQIFDKIFQNSNNFNGFKP